MHLGKYLPRRTQLLTWSLPVLQRTSADLSASMRLHPRHTANSRRVRQVEMLFGYTKAMYLALFLAWLFCADGGQVRL